MTTDSSEPQSTSFISRSQKLLGSFNLETISFGIILALVFLLPIFIIPSSTVVFQASKSLVVYIGIALALAIFLGLMLQRGTLTIPIEYVFGALIALPVIYLVSALASPSPITGIVGDLYGPHTFVFLLVMVIFVGLVTILFRDKNRIFYSYLVFFAAFFIITLYQIAKLLIGGSALSFGVLTSPSSNLIGTWNDFGIVMGAVTLLSLITLEMLPVGRWFRVALYAALGISVALLILVNFQLIWLLMGAFTLIFFVYVFSLDRARISHSASQTTTENMNVYNTSDTFESSDSPNTTNSRASMYALTLGVLAISVVLMISQDAGTVVSSAFGVNQQNIYPWTATLEVARESLSEFPIVGAGPNQFELQWLKHKPLVLNQTPIWNVDFTSGEGYILTSLITVGALGFAAWIAFLALFVWVGFRAVFTTVTGYARRYLITSSFLVALYLWIIAVAYTPNMVVLTFAFFFTGLFFASAAEAGALRTRTFNLFTRPRVSFAAVMVLIVLLISSIVLAYYTSRAVVASSYFYDGVRVYNTEGALKQAQRSIARAIHIRELDQYYRTLAQLGQARLSGIMGKEPAETESQQKEIQRDFQAVFGTALQNAQSAVEYNRSDYRNWLVYAQTFHAVMPVQTEGVYERAAQLYDEAIKRNSTSPALLLARAQLERANGNKEEAREYIRKALNKKVNYTAARFVLAQIEMEENNTQEAIQSLNAAATRDPNNPAIFFQLGVLYYNTDAYADAITVLERALELTGDNYANARYFLGLSYAENGDRQSSLQQFEVLEENNPDNREIGRILSNIRRGREPLQGLISEPARRAELPVDEDMQDENEERGEIDVDVPSGEGATTTDTEEIDDQ